MGIDNIITFDAHDPRVMNAIPLNGFENVMPSYQFIKGILKNVKDITIDADHLMIISPDEGATNRAIYLANVLGVDMGMFYKRRDYSRIVDGRNPIVEYIHALKENGKLIGGSEERKEQAKYNVELVYIQDQDMVENQEDAGLALNCPNCGAPLPGLGAKKCIYCDTPIVEYNLRIWNFSRVEEA